VIILLLDNMQMNGEQANFEKNNLLNFIQKVIEPQGRSGH
jgi:hypothetical protein